MEQSESNSLTASWKWVSRSSAFCSLLLGGIFLIPLMVLAAGWLFHINLNAWLAPAANNWLITIMKLHAGLLSPTPDPLFGFNFLDFIILFLVNEVVFGLSFPLLKMKRWWVILAMLQPLIGMVLFITTQQAGRSSVMGGIFVLTLVQLPALTDLDRSTSWLGILGSLLLFLGDITTGIFSSISMAYLTATGYLLLTAWFFLAAIQLFRSANKHAPDGV